MSRSTLDVHVRGDRIRLIVDENTTPTSYSLFLANVMSCRAADACAVDAGSGSGILAITLAMRGVKQVLAVERNPEACDLIEENARVNGVSEAVRVVAGDIKNCRVDTRVDVVVANPPTMPEQVDVPVFARGGGADGSGFVAALVQRAREWLVPDGRIEIAISSVLGDGAFRDLCWSAGMTATPQSTLILPFRGFYYQCYPPDLLHLLAEEKRVLGDQHSTLGLSEFVTVYECRLASV